MKIKISNYQRLIDIELNLKPGINLISGNSNNGKSSTIRAIRDFIFNKISNDKIRHGEKELSIAIDNAEATRTSKGTVYNIAGEKFEKVGKTILPEIVDKFNITELKINGVAIKPNFSFQMDKPFLFDKTPGQRNDLIIGTKNDKYLKTLKNIKSEQQELSKVTKKVLEEVIDTLTKKNLETEKQIKKLEGVEELEQQILKYQEEKQILDKYFKLTECLVKTKELNSKLDTLNKNLNSFKDIDEKIQNLKEQANKLAGLNNLVEKYKESSSKFKRYKIKMEELEKNISIAKNIEESINNVKSSKEKYDKLYQLYNDARRNHLTAKNHKENLESIISDLNKTQKEFSEFKEEIKVCPLCGGNL